MIQKVLVLAPTSMELDALTAHAPVSMKIQKGPWQVRFTRFANRDALAMVCGIGPSLAAACASFALCSFAVERVILAGLAGSLQEHPSGTVLQASSEQFLDLGSTDETGQFQPLANRLPLLEGQELPQILKAESLQANLPAAAMGTASRICSGDEERAWIQSQFPDIACESMEGASVASICHLFGTPFHEIRSISNLCGERDRSKWDFPGALNALKTVGLEVLG